MAGAPSPPLPPAGNSLTHVEHDIGEDDVVMHAVSQGDPLDHQVLPDPRLYGEGQREHTASDPKVTEDQFNCWEPQRDVPRPVSYQEPSEDAEPVLDENLLDEERVAQELLQDPTEDLDELDLLSTATEKPGFKALGDAGQDEAAIVSCERAIPRVPTASPPTPAPPSPPATHTPPTAPTLTPPTPVMSTLETVHPTPVASTSMPPAAAPLPLTPSATAPRALTPPETAPRALTPTPPATAPRALTPPATAPRALTPTPPATAPRALIPPASTPHALTPPATAPRALTPMAAAPMAATPMAAAPLAPMPLEPPATTPLALPPPAFVTSALLPSGPSPPGLSPPSLSPPGLMPLGLQSPALPPPAFLYPALVPPEDVFTRNISPQDDTMGMSLEHEIHQVSTVSPGEPVCGHINGSDAGEEHCEAKFGNHALGRKLQSSITSDIVEVSCAYI